MPTKKKPLELNESSSSSSRLKKLNIAPAQKKVTLTTHAKVNKLLKTRLKLKFFEIPARGSST